MRYKNRMNTKNLMVSFVAIAMALFLVATVSATLTTSSTGNLNIYEVSVDGMYANSILGDIGVTAGETITVKVYFTIDAGEELSDVVFKAELGDSEVEVERATLVADGNSSSGRIYLNIKVPYDFDDDELHKDETLEITVEGENDSGYDFEATAEVELKIKRPDYNVDFKSINVAKNVEAGKTFQVDVVLKNTGYNDLEDLFITARISALNLEQRFWFGDLVDSKEDSTSIDDDDTDTLHRRFSFSVPYGIESGEYTLEVEVSNEDTVLSETVIVEITNKFPSTVIKSGNDLILVNPTDSMVGYKIIAESPASVSENIVFVQAGSSETVTVTPNAEGEYEFSVGVFSMDGELVRTVSFSGSQEVSQIVSPIVILTIVLAIIFLVLLVVLIVLVTKKPEKTEEFGESYY